MNKDQLQAELLNKVKPGIKPSDLKKPQAKISPIQFNQQSLATPPDSPVLKPSQEDTSILPEIKLNQAAEQALTKANHKIRDQEQIIQKLQAKNQNLTKTLQELKNQAKNKPTMKDQSTQTPPQPKEPKLYLFTCDICEQNKKSQLHLAKVNGLAIDPNKQNKICDYCIRKVDLIQERKGEFF